MACHPDRLLPITPSLLRDLLSALGHRLPPKLSGSALVHALFTGTLVPTKKAAATLRTLARFTPRPARLALVEAARASDFPDPDALLSLPHADVAARLLLDLERTTKPSRRRAIRRLFALAAHRIARDLPEHPTYEAVALPTFPRDRDAAAITKALRRALSSRLVDLWDTTDADGTQRFALFVEQPTESRLALESTRSSSRSCTTLDHSRTAGVDLLRVFTSGDVTRVALTATMPELLPVYASALGLSLGPSFTLRPLKTLTREALVRVAHATPGVARIAVVAVRYRTPTGRRIELRDDDALDPAHGIPRSGYIDRATIRVTLADGTTVDAFLQLPHRLDVSDRAHEGPVRAALCALGLFAPGALPDDARSLAPYEHGDWRWRAVVGDAGFERLLKAKLLLRVLSSHVSSHEHRMHGAAYLVRDVPGEPDLQYALAEDRSLGARLVGPKDRVAYRLDTRALAARMMGDLDARPAPAPLAIAGVLDLGVVALPSGKLRVVYAMAEPAEGWVDAVRRACGVGVTPVVLVPKGHAGEAKGMLEVELDVEEQLGCKRAGRLLGRIAEALGVGDEVEARRRYDEDLLVETAKERIWVTGVPVALNEHRWKYVSFIASKKGAVAPTKDIGASVSRSAYPDVVARRMKVQVDRQVRRELEKAGVDSSIVDRMIVGEGRQGYRFGVTVRVL